MDNLKYLESIESIDTRIKEISTELCVLREERRKLANSVISMEGKYLNMGELGYMYVKYQEIIGGTIVLRGVYFKGNISEYRDNFYLESDADFPISIKTDIFTSELENKEIVEISKEEFVSRFNELVCDYQKSFVTLL